MLDRRGIRSRFRAARRRSISLTRCTPEVGDHASAPRSTAASCRCKTQLAERRSGRDHHVRGADASPTWERFVVTGKARARIRRFVRTQQRPQYHLCSAAPMIQKAFRQEGYDFPTRRWRACSRSSSCHAVDDLYAAVGEGNVTGATWCTRSSRQPRPRAGRRRSCRCARPRRRARSKGTHPDPRPDPGHGGAFRRLLPSAAGRPHRRHRHHRQGRHHPHHRLRDAGELRRDAGALARRRLETAGRRRPAMSAASASSIANEPGSLGACPR